MDPDLVEFFVHTVSVEPFEGESGYGGTIYGAPVDVACFVDETTRMVRATDGSEVVSSSTVYAGPDAPITNGSRVTLPSGDTTVVVATSRHDSGPLDLPDHLEAACE